MKKGIIIILALIWIVQFTSAQQIPHYSQYMYNSYIVNPALAGTHNYFQIWSNNRFQWAGIPDSPLTNTLSMYGPFKDYNMGWGAYLYNDVTGPISNTAIYGSYAYNISINNDMKISGGLSIGMFQYRIDGKKIVYTDDPTLPTDPFDQSIIDNIYKPDANFGLYLYSSNYHVGFAAHQLFHNNIQPFKSVIGDTLGDRLSTHFFLSGGYKYFINRDFAVEPSLLVKMVKASPMQLDIGFQVIYQNMIWGGLSFRTMDALSIMLGYTYENIIYLGYSYDIGVSKFRTVHSGSHEIIIGYKFNSIKD